MAPDASGVRSEHGIPRRGPGAAGLKHTLIAARDKHASAAFLVELLGPPPPEPLFHILVVRTANGVSLDFLETSGPIEGQHFAFLVSDAEFDAIFGRILARGLPYWADPAAREPGRINTLFGGRGVYFQDPSGHLLEILTRPYRSGD